MIFVGPEAKIRLYAGRGPLGGWLRATIVHATINYGVREDRHRPLSSDGFDDAIVAGDDPALAVFRERYGPKFRLAFRDALAALTPDETNFLRWSVIEGKNIDAIAAMVRMHRATVARRLAACRTKLYEATRDALAEHVPGSATELHSMMAALQSVVETSLRHFLGF